MDQKRYYRVVNNKNGNKRAEKSNNNSNYSSTWSPISDLKLQQVNGDNQDVQTQIDNVLHGPKTKSRLPVFKQICPDQN